MNVRFLLLLLYADASFTWVEPTIFRVLNPNTVQPHAKELIHLNDTNSCKRCALNGPTDFIAAELTGTNLQGACLVQAEFIQANIELACFKKADIRFATFCYAQATSTNFSYCKGDRTSFVGAFLSQANFMYALLNECFFQQALCNSTNFEHAELSFSILRNGQFAQANFNNSQAIHLKANNTIISRATFLSADCSWSIFNHCTGTMTEFDYACLKHCSFKGSDLRGARFCFADLSATDFTGCDLRGADFTGAIITETTIFKRAKLQDTIINLDDLKRTVHTRAFMPDGMRAET